MATHIYMQKKGNKENGLFLIEKLKFESILKENDWKIMKVFGTIGKIITSEIRFCKKKYKIFLVFWT